MSKGLVPFKISRDVLKRPVQTSTVMTALVSNYAIEKGLEYNTAAKIPLRKIVDYFRHEKRD